MITRDDLPVSALADAYDLGPWESIEMLPGGKSDHYRLIAGSGEYAIRRSHRSKTCADMHFEHELVRHLRDNGFPAPAVVPTVSGDTCAAVDGDLYSVSVFVDGSGYEAGNAEHLRETARALAEYHRISASFRPLSSRSQEPFLNEILRERLTKMPPPEAICDFADAYADHDLQIPDLLESLHYALEKSEAVLSLLDRLYPELPLLTNHGGYRRGSALFSGDRLITMLDFDSARYEARVLDLAIARSTTSPRYSGSAVPATSRFLYTWRSYRGSWALTCRPTHWSEPKSRSCPCCSPRDHSRGPSASIAR